MLACKLHAVYLRIDTIEQGLRDLCSFDVEGEGYRLAYRIASDNLRLGLSVVADSCNPIELTRREWEQVARESQADYRNIEVICSDPAEHRHRVETRISDVQGLRLPTWSDVEHREYHEWTVHRIIVDTSGKTEQECANELLSKLSESPRCNAMTERPKFTSIDDYIAAASPDVKPILEAIRKLIQANVPNAQETISYQMPAFKLRRTFIYFAAFKQHIGIYPPVKNDAALIKELLPFSNEKGNLKFPLNQPIPYELIGRVAVALARV